MPPAQYDNLPPTPANGAEGNTAAVEAPSGVRIAQLRGIPIYVQPTWLIIAAVLLTIVVKPSVPDSFGQLGGYVIALMFAPLLYGSVLIHELGHSLLAQHFGMKVRAISLQLLGGVSEIETESPSAGKEFAVAFIGPVVSFALCAICWPLALAVDNNVARVLLGMLAGANLVVALFNLLPGLPLDGGRVLHAAVWAATGNRRRGLVVAAWGGRVLAILLLLSIPFPLIAWSDRSPISLAWLAIIAIFLWSGASQALRMDTYQSRAKDLTAAQFARRVVIVPGQLSVAEAMRRAILAHASAILVSEDGDTVRGMVSVPAVQAMPEDRRAEVVVADLTRQLDQQAMLPADIAGERLLAAMHAAPSNEYLLTDESGTIVSVLLADDVIRVTHAW